MNLFERIQPVKIHSFGTWNVKCKYLVTVEDRNYEVNSDVFFLIYLLKKSLSVEEVAIKLTVLYNKTHTVDDINHILNCYIYPMLNNESATHS